jgi:hypothetical protein
MPHVVRFKLTNPKDRKLILQTCDALGIHVDEFAKHATYEAINRILNQWNKQKQAQAEAAASRKEAMNASTSPDTSGADNSVQSEAAASDSLAETEASPAPSAG